MDSPFKLSECRTTSPQLNDSSPLPSSPLCLSSLMHPDTPSLYNTHLPRDRQLFASPSPVIYNCHSSFTPVSAFPPWSPFRTPFELSLAFRSPSGFVRSVSPVIRSDYQRLSRPPSLPSTPFVQRLLSVRPAASSSPPPSIVSSSSDPTAPSIEAESPLSSPPNSQADELEFDPSFVQSIADKVKRTRRTVQSSPRVLLPAGSGRSCSTTLQAKRKADLIDEVRQHPFKVSRREQVDNNDEGSGSGSKSRSEDVITYNSSSYPVQTYPLRSFSPETPLHPAFPLFYRRFPVSSHQTLKSSRIPGATFNVPRSRFDLYTPRFVKGTGREKLGLCPICVEPVARGGQGKKVWLSTKFSAFNYHMQYSHGISVVSAAPFSPPIEFRVKLRTHVAKHERDHITEGKCHKCNKWIALETVKDTEVKVKEIFWWKHSASCHQGSLINGECDIFLDDAIYRTVLSWEEDVDCD